MDNAFLRLPSGPHPLRPAPHSAWQHSLPPSCRSSLGGTRPPPPTSLLSASCERDSCPRTAVERLVTTSNIDISMYSERICELSLQLSQRTSRSPPHALQCIDAAAFLWPRIKHRTLTPTGCRIRGNLLFDLHGNPKNRSFAQKQSAYAY